jgi:hypothetical protein
MCVGAGLMDDAEPTQPKYQRSYLDRASARTEQEREDHYAIWLDERELEDDPERREVWFRRYERPDPPSSIPGKTLEEIRGNTA